MPARGHHVCSLGTADELFNLAAPFLRAGLARREKCLFLAHDHETRAVERALILRKVPLKSARKAGVEVATCEQAGLAALPFSPARTIARWEKGCETATAEGYAGLRVVVEMTWALYGGLDRLAEYEAKSAPLFQEWPLAAICHYDRLCFSEAVLRDAVLAHPDLGIAGEIAANPDYLPCDAMLARLRATGALNGGVRSSPRGRRLEPAASRRRS